MSTCRKATQSLPCPAVFVGSMLIYDKRSQLAADNDLPQAKEAAARITKAGLISRPAKEPQICYLNSLQSGMKI